MNGGVSESGRRRGESFASTVGEEMHVDESKVDDEENEPDDSDDVQDSESRRYPTKLRGRGGFGHARGSERGRGLGTPTTAAISKTGPTTNTTQKDTVDSLTSSMSALQFIPYSVRTGRGRGRGRGV